MKGKDKTKSKLIIETNRRLQETTQKLFMAKQELEKKNKELEEARLREKEQKEQLEQELKVLKHLVRHEEKPPKHAEPIKPIPGKRLTKSVAEDLSLKYIQLLRLYFQTKDLDKEGHLAEELCQKLIEYDITPKGIISLHLKAVPQVRTIGSLETQRISFESRIVLLKVMTRYASILRQKVVKK